MLISQEFWTKINNFSHFALLVSSLSAAASNATEEPLFCKCCFKVSSQAQRAANDIKVALMMGMEAKNIHESVSISKNNLSCNSLYYLSCWIENPKSRLEISQSNASILQRNHFVCFKGRLEPLPDESNPYLQSREIILCHGC